VHTRLKGFSLLEVLIAAAMLSALLTSALILQLKQMRAQQYANQNSIASTQLFSLLERLKVVPIDQRSQVLSEWREQNSLLLPDTKGEYHCPKRCWAKLQWGTRPRYSLTMGKL
jgi:prepilin-type N-terminal cleavage/methylation domain-containing protein